MKKSVCIVLADGFEEIEAFTPADVLARLGYKVILLGLDDLSVAGSHGIKVTADKLFSPADALACDGIVLPGGMPGSKNLRDSASLRETLVVAKKQGKVIGAICAAPNVLKSAGIIEDVSVTGYPGSEGLSGVPGIRFNGERASVTGSVVTGKGPGASFDFAFALACTLGSDRKDVEELYDGMFVKK